MRAIGMLMVTFGVLLFGTLLGGLTFAGWLLASQNGARQLLEWLPQDEQFALHVEEVEGRLLGPLTIQGLTLDLPAARIELDHARLEWAPGALFRGEARIARLALGHLVVRLRDTDELPDDAPPRVPELPLAILVDRASVERFELHLPPVPDAESRAPQVVEQIALDRFEWRGERVAIERLAATHAQVGTLEAAAQARLAATRVQIDQLGVIRKGEVPTRLDASGVVQLDDRDSKIELSWRELRWPLEGEAQVFSREGRMQLEGRAQDLRAQAAFALGESANVEASARYAAERMEAKLAWSKLAWPLSGAARVASARGTLDVSGTPENYRYTLDAQLAAEGQSGAARASGSGGLDHLLLDTLRFAVAKSTIEGKGRVEWSPALIANADLRVQNLDPGLIAPAWPGRINGTMQARTRMQGDTPQVQFTVALKDSRLRDYPLSLDARGEAAGASVKLDRATLVSGGTKLTASGQVTPPFAFEAALDSPDLSALWPGLRGRAQLDANVRGALAAPHVIAKGSVDELAINELSVKRITLDADLNQAGAWTLDLEVSELSGPVEMAQARAELRGRATDHVLKLSADAEPADAELELRGAYDAARRAWTGALAQGRFVPRGLAEWTLAEPATLQASAALIQLEPACWRAPESRVCLQALREPARLRGAFRVEAFDFAYFRTFLPPGWAVSGGMDGSAMVELRSGRLSEARADLATSPIEVQRDGQPLLKAERGTLNIEEVAGRAVAQLRLRLQGGSIAFDAALAPGSSDYSARALSGQLDVALDDLGFLRLASEEIAQFGGQVRGRMNLSGTLAQPQPEGELKLIDGGLKLLTPGIELTAVQARVAASGGDGVLRIDASAQSGGGTLSVEGRANVSSTPTTVQLAIRGDNFQAANMAEARAWISPKLDLSVTDTRIDLRGEIDVPRADITPPDFASGVAPSGDQVIVTREEEVVAGGGTPLFADVRVNLGDQVRFEGFGLKTRLAGSVRAYEQPGRPSSGRGEVRLVEGRYKAYGQDLEIETGRLLFNGGPLTEPAIEIRAQRKPREDIEVGVLVRGTLDKPEFQLFSTPAMPRERQLSWLVLGRSIEDGGSGDEKAMIANAALSLGLSGTDFLAQNLRSGLGLDEISIGSDPGDEAQEARFTVGKYLSPKLYVSYGVGIFQPGQVFKLLYELGRGFKFSTESGVHTGGDLLYSIER